MAGRQRSHTSDLHLVRGLAAGLFAHTVALVASRRHGAMDKRTLALALVAKHRLGDVRMIPAGRELDRMIAEQVMGWVPYDGHWIVPDGTSYGRMVDFPETLICDDRDDSAGLPHYSTAGSAALKVWEKLVEMGYRVSVCWGPGWGQCADTGFEP